MPILSIPIDKNVLTTMLRYNNGYNFKLTSGKVKYLCPSTVSVASLNMERKSIMFYIEINSLSNYSLKDLTNK